MNHYFIEFIEQFKQDLSNGKDKSIISYERYGPNSLNYGPDSRKEPLEYFLWYVKDKGYEYNVHEEIKDVSDAMEGCCKQCIKFITIQLK